MDVLLDSNWLVTLSAILASIYVFVIGVPVIIQQAFLPEEVREVYNSKSSQKRNSDLRGLINIGSSVFFFILFIANPSYKFLLSDLKPDHQKFWLLFFQLIVICSFLVVIYNFYLFARRNFFYSRVINRKGLKNIVLNNGSYSILPRTNNIRERVIISVINDVYSNYKNSTLDEIDIEDLITIAKALKLSHDQELILQSLKAIVSNIVNSEVTIYNGHTVGPIITKVIKESIFEDVSTVNSSNINLSIEIMEIVYNKYKSTNWRLSTYDSEAVQIFLYEISVDLIRLKKTNNHSGILSKILDLLRKFPNSIIRRFYIFKLLFEEKKYNFFINEISEFKNLKNKDEQLGYYLSYIAWFKNNINIQMQGFALKSFFILTQNNKLSSTQIKNISDEFFLLNEFDTANDLLELSKDTNFIL